MTNLGVQETWNVVQMEFRDEIVQVFTFDTKGEAEEELRLLMRENPTKKYRLAPGERYPLVGKLDTDA